MRVLFVVGREIDYTRNQVLLRAFQHIATVDVVAADRPVRSNLTNSLWQSLRASIYLTCQRYDLVYVGFYGFLILWLLQPWLFFYKYQKRPVLFDAFVSNFDTLCLDRQVVRPNSLVAQLIHWFDRASCLLAMPGSAAGPPAGGGTAPACGAPAGTTGPAPVHRANLRAPA